MNEPENTIGRRQTRPIHCIPCWWEGTEPVLRSTDAPPVCPLCGDAAGAGPLPETPEPDTTPPPLSAIVHGDSAGAYHMENGKWVCDSPPVTSDGQVLEPFLGASDPVWRCQECGVSSPRAKWGVQLTGSWGPTAKKSGRVCPSCGAVKSFSFPEIASRENTTPPPLKSNGLSGDEGGLSAAVQDEMLKCPACDWEGVRSECTIVGLRHYCPQCVNQSPWALREVGCDPAPAGIKAMVCADITWHGKQPPLELNDLPLDLLELMYRNTLQAALNLRAELERRG